LARRVAARPGLRVPGAWDGLELAVRAILGQQVSVARATQLAGKLVAAFGTAVAQPEPGLTHLFPTAEALARAGAAAIARAVGMPSARGAAIAELAAAIVDGRVALDRVQPFGELRARLLELRGIGPWTVDYLAMRLGEPDAFPVGDLGIRRALGRQLTPAELLARADAFRPWRAYAALHLWTSDSEVEA
jgi:AraC family transcriptional regulator of adaptative response / DNA-3-methyladenine glycosylase II